MIFSASFKDSIFCEKSFGGLMTQLVYLEKLLIVYDSRKSKKDQNEYKSDKRPKTKTKKNKKNVSYNIEKLYKSRGIVIKFCEEYSLRISEAKIKPTHGEGFNGFLRV